jgi:hypothetical protein
MNTPRRPLQITVAFVNINSRTIEIMRPIAVLT